MASRYELSDRQWSAIAGLLPGRAETVGRTAVDNRLFVNGCLWVIRSGARWSDLPPRYGNWKSAHKRFSRWAEGRVWERIFASLLRDKTNEYAMIDATIVRAHRLSVSGKGGPKTRRWGAPAVD